MNYHRNKNNICKVICSLFPQGLFSLRLTHKVRHTTLKKGLKGQMFVRAAIIIVIGLIMIKNILGVYGIMEEKRTQETGILDKQLRNIKNEYGYAIAAAAMQANINDSGISYLSNFSDFIRSENDAKIFYLFAFANGSNQNYYLTVGNYMNDMINITSLAVTTSSPSSWQISAMNDKTNLTNSFSSSINGTINVTINYTLSGTSISEFVPLTVDTKNRVIGFFDISLYSGNDFIRTKFVYNATRI